jgi:hypothetical protein
LRAKAGRGRLDRSSLGEEHMARREVCGNDYDKAFSITRGQRTSTFDSFECAIHARAPNCAHCARESGVRGVDDRA